MIRASPIDWKLVAAWAIKILLGLVVIALLIVAAAALAEPVHRLLVNWGAMAAEPHAERLDGFLKVFRRLLVILLVGAGVLYFRPWRQMRAGKDDYGLRGSRARLRPALIGFGSIVALSILMLTWHFFFEGWLKFEDPIDWGKFARRFARTLLTPALTVAAFEEFFFRGWLQARAQTVFAPFRAALLVSIGYAFVHAFRPSSSAMEVEFNTAGALEAFRAWLGHAVDPSGFGPAFLGLALFGLMLTAAYLRTRTLWTSIGIHMGGIWIIYSYGSITDRHPGRTWAGGKLLYDGPPGWILLAVATWILWPKGGAGAGAGRKPEPEPLPLP